MADDRSSWRPHPTLLRWAAAAACLVVIGIAAVGGAMLLGRLRLVLLPVVVATFLTRALDAPAGFLERRGLPPAPRAALVVLGFLAVLAGVTVLIARPMAGELSDLGTAVRDGVDQLEDWLVREGPFDVDREEIERLEERAGDEAKQALEGSTAQVATGAQRALEVLAGLVLALILTFFAVKDGDRFQRWATERLPTHRREEGQAMATAGWAALGGYLRGAAILGLVEGAVIGVTLLLVGADLVLPIALLTFVAAFVPLVGATFAGAVAVLATLVTAGGPEALIVLAVAIAVQQLDNDLLAPWIYGRSLELHPVVILLSIVTGTALFGFAGTVLAVPVTAVAISAWSARRSARLVAPDPTG